MASVLEGFEEKLAGLTRRFPRAEDRLVRLLLLALEREQIAATAYRESVIEVHVAALPIPEAARLVIREAIARMCRDEEAHAVFIREELRARGSALLRARAFLAQASGLVGGWSGSVLQHRPWREAPLARTLARALVGAGALAGKVPREVRAHLDFHGFRRYCAFNVDTETTAALSFARMGELARAVAPGLEEPFARMREDEEEHVRLFALFASALDEGERLAMSPEELAEAVRGGRLSGRT